MEKKTSDRRRLGAEIRRRIALPLRGPSGALRFCAFFSIRYQSAPSSLSILLYGDSDERRCGRHWPRSLRDGTLRPDVRLLLSHAYLLYSHRPERSPSVRPLFADCSVDERSERKTKGGDHGTGRFEGRTQPDHGGDTRLPGYGDHCANAEDS